ncbi:MAG: hypothetical protein L3J96_04515 [Thermoplasmata archaeon]|nr:hypothetical protein [Thermoplasmata archaeon]
MGPTARALAASSAPALTLAFARSMSGTETNYQETLPLVWAILIISIIGAALTFGFVVYAIVRFRDPTTRGRRYG